MSTARIFAIVLLFLCPLAPLRATDVDLAAKATNQLGVDLHRQLATGDENLCLSPYSIQSALAMTFAGADGETRTEMARVLHFPSDGDAIFIYAIQHLPSGACLFIGRVTDPR